MLKIGVFGTGHLGKFHLNNWKEIEGAELAGFFDPDDKTAAEISSKYNLKRFDTIDALLDACDAVDIIAPTSFHFDLCKAAIKKGKHVFVEKPLALTLEEIHEIEKLMTPGGPRLMVGFNRRFSPLTLRLKSALELYPGMKSMI